MHFTKVKPAGSIFYVNKNDVHRAVFNQLQWDEPKRGAYENAREPRALQAPVLKVWKGDPTNVADAQRAFHHRAWCNSKARFGKYTEEMETKKAVA